MENPWLPVDPHNETGYRRRIDSVLETKDADGVIRLAEYDKLLMQWHWIDGEGMIEYPPNYPNWVPTHWREAKDQ